jgi:hypothetical protein
VLVAAACRFDEYHNAAVALSVGGALFLAGWLLRIWAQRHLGYRLKTARALTTCGPFAFVRNPIYLGNTLMILGAVAAAEVFWMLPLALLWCAPVYSLVVRHEERRLVRTYGRAYLAYQDVVPRWRPLLWTAPLPCPHRGWGRPLLVELHTPLIMAPALLKLWLLPALLSGVLTTVISVRYRPWRASPTLRKTPPPPPASRWFHASAGRVRALRTEFLPLSRPSVGEAEVAAVTACLRSGWVTSGPQVAEFERAFAAQAGARRPVRPRRGHATSCAHPARLVGAQTKSSPNAEATQLRTTAGLAKGPGAGLVPVEPRIR